MPLVVVDGGCAALMADIIGDGRMPSLPGIPLAKPGDFGNMSREDPACAAGN